MHFVSLSDRAEKLLATAFSSWVAILLAILASTGCVRAETAINRVHLKFGDVTIRIERRLIRAVLGAPGVRLRDSTISVPAGAVVPIEVPSSVKESELQSCPTSSFVYLINQPAAPPEQNPGLNNLRATPSRHDGIDKMMYESPGGRVLDLYQFHSSSLVDYSGHQITFYIGKRRVTANIATTNIQVGKDFRVTMTTTPDTCFFQSGERIVGKLRQFVFDRIE